MGALSVSSNMVEVSLIFGGMSPEHAASRESFSYVYDQLCTENCGVCISHVYYVDSDNYVSFYDFDRSWHSRDYMVSKNAVDYATFAKHVLGANGYIVNLLHGNYGEDGHIQGLANIVGLRGTFGPVLPSSLAMSKIHMQCYVSGSQSTIKVPATLTLTDAKSCSAVAEIKNLFDGLKVVVKPNSLGVSLFTERYTVSDIEISIIEDNLRAIFKYDERALIQEFVEGQEYSIGCIRLDHKVVVLPAIRIDTKRGFFGHEEKHRIGSADEVLMEEDTVEILHMKRVSRDLFDELGFSHMCRFDYILTPSGDVYFLEANPIPGLMRNSNLPKMLNGYGLSLADMTLNFVSQDDMKVMRLSKVDYTID
ncbi:D-alanine--D-alanine ligase [Pseudomonas sp. K5002]|uniref:D-alanine--D-alanine ligase family protein n=1 Tax=Pseudomonas sp. K5002 TaxID=2738828 RepID=UPI0015BE342D|nr:D-alanine--D-alanine ligase [Pseudomonas sp. K5002]NWD85460.1 D-alanine--D-alanine ligase [Pseudomonas sp. K5002]